MMEFLKMKKNLTYTPVKPAAQQLFADTFVITRTPVFGFIKRDLSKTIKSKS
jgi:hypothetical protein